MRRVEGGGRGWRVKGEGRRGRGWRVESGG